MTDSPAKVVMITGAAGGLGSELALCCALAGWESILVDNDKLKLEILYDRILDAGGTEPVIHVMDFASTSPDDGVEITRVLQQKYRGLDALVHCAVAFAGLQPLDQLAPDDWLRMMQVNVNTPWLLSVACLPLLKSRPRASLIFLAEDMDKMRTAYWGAYGVSKWGLDALAGQFASELDNTKIQVLYVDPGPLRTALRSRVYHLESVESLRHPSEVAAKIMHILERGDVFDDYRLKLG